MITLYMMQVILLKTLFHPYRNHSKKFSNGFPIIKCKETYKLKSGYKPKIFSDLLNQKEISPYNLRRHPEFRAPLTRTVYHRSESISYLCPKIWNILATSFKEAVSLNSFKKLIKK